MKLLSPYRNSGAWYKGSLHIHSNFSKCGWHDISEIALAYRDYDFIAVTDHDRITTEAIELENKVIFKGYEVSGARHMLLIEMPFDNDFDNTFSISNYSNLAEKTVNNRGFAVINHPTRLAGQHWSEDEIINMKNIIGLEIFSGDGINIEEDTSFPLWDKILSKGKHLWGFGNDDFHHWGQERRVWNVVNAEDNTKNSILEALINGDFYVSNGYGFKGIYVKENNIIFKFDDHANQLKNAYKYLTLFGKNGKVLAERTGKFSEYIYNVQGDEGYIRAEVYISGGYGAYSQPIYVRA